MAGNIRRIPLGGSPRAGATEHIAAAAALAAQQAEAARTPPSFTKGTQLVIAFQWSDADAVQAIRMLEWWQSLGVSYRPDIVSFCPRRTSSYLKDHVRKLLDDVSVEHQAIEPAFDLPDERYPRGSVWGFWHLAQACHAAKSDFLLMEPDAVPLTSTWWQSIVTEWDLCKWPYLGHIEPAHGSGGYPKHMAGCGVYHHDVWNHVSFDRLDLAWDVALAGHVAPQACQSQRIQQVFGSGEPPRIRSIADVRRLIRKDAVLFHRNKDGRLIELLREHRSDPVAVDGGAA